MTSRKKFLSSIAAGMLLLATGATQTAMAESVPFAGKDNLCGVDLSRYTMEEKRSKTTERNLVYFYRTEVPGVPELTGSAVMSFDFVTLADGRQYTTGEIYFVPDTYHAGGFREELKKLLIVDPLTGTFTGMGSLSGAVANYTLHRNNEEAEYCYDHPYCDDPGAECLYLEQLGAPPIGNDFSGTLHVPE